MDKKFVSEDKKTFIVAFYIMSNLSKFSNADFLKSITIKTITYNEIKESVYMLTSLGKAAGDKYFTAWDFAVNNYKQAFDDIIYDYKDNSFMRFSIQKDESWNIFDYDTETWLYIVSDNSYIQIYDFKQDKYSLYSYSKKEDNETRR